MVETHNIDKIDRKEKLMVLGPVAVIVVLYALAFGILYALPPLEETNTSV